MAEDRDFSDLGGWRRTRMMGRVKASLQRLAAETFTANQHHILDLIAPDSYASICDLGCDDGAWSLEVAKVAHAKRIFGVEIVGDRAQLARQRGLEVAIADLNQPLPFDEGAFDLVHANQVIEHVSDLDTFLAEIRRVLRPGGVSIISTENASSWHNIGAAVLGWQIFSLTNVSRRTGGIGNPFALHRGERPEHASWTHKTVFNYRGLVEIMDLYGLQPVAVRGAGYHPLPPVIGRLDPRHAHLLAVKAVRR
jgi:SAM-dependent methyltransferase